VFLWFLGLSFLAVWLVFRDPAIDYRLVMVGAVLPDVIDAPTGGRWLAHTLLVSVTVLFGVMLATRGRRLLRRQLIAIPIGMLLHLVLDGMWTDRETFWWPAFGAQLPDAPLPSIDRGAVNILLELAGLAVLIWAWQRFQLSNRDYREKFLRRGRLPRELVDGR
jgi:hypothetical protein